MMTRREDRGGLHQIYLDEEMTTPYMKGSKVVLNIVDRILLQRQESLLFGISKNAFNR